MAEQIEDGTGTGRKAKVDIKHRLHVNSVSHSGEEVHTFEGTSYIIHAECHMAATPGGGLLAFKYIGEKKINVLTLSVDALVLTEAAKISVVKNPVIASGTLVTGKAIQRNGSSNNELASEITISDGSSDLTLTGGEVLTSLAIQSLQSKDRSPRGAFIMQKNDIFLVGWDAFTGNGIDGEIISLTIGIYEFVDDDFE